jgi:1-acyl-sn-glycerol-3-phosphate acyltransferase
LITASCPEEVSFLARASLFRYKIFSLLITNLNAYPVGGGKQDLAAFKLLGKLLHEGKKVVVFPEGVRTFDGELSTIKTGVAMLALRNKCAIVPVYIYGTYDAWPRGRRFPKPWGRTACVFGKPIEWEPYALLDKKEAFDKLTDKVAASILDLRDWYMKGAYGPMPN